MPKLTAATRLTEVGGKFGRTPKHKSIRPRSTAVGPLVAMYGGLIGGTAAGVKGYRATAHRSQQSEIKEIRSNRGNLAANTRRKRKAMENQFTKSLKVYVPKGPVHRITDMGTRAGKYKLGQDSPQPVKRKLLGRHTAILGSYGLGTGVAGGVAIGHKGKKQLRSDLAASKQKLDRSNQELKRLGIKKGLINPKSVAQGQRIRMMPKKAHKARPKVGKGNYVKAPLLRDKVVQPRWSANAALNNPGNLLAAGSIGAGLGVLAGNQRKKVSKSDRTKNATAGALIGGGAGQFGRVGAGYGAKSAAERQFKPLTNKGNYGPYKEGPHKDTLRSLEREATKAGKAAGHGKSARAKAAHFSENFPKGVPSYRARRVLQTAVKKPAVAGAVLGGAAIGAGLGASKKVHKARSMSDAELRRRKVTQAHTSQALGTMGLAALGATLASTKTGGKGTKALFAATGKKRPGFLKPKHLKKATTPLLTTSAGIGGAAAFNNASISSAEAKRRKMNVIGKAANWEAVSTGASPERKRRKRLEHYDTATALGGGAAGVGGSIRAIQGLNHTHEALNAPRTTKGTVRATHAVGHARHLKLATRANKQALGLGAAGAGLMAANAVIQGKKDKSFASYSKSATSAFGVDHG